MPAGPSVWKAKREAYADDQGAATSLVAVTAGTNRSKADQVPAEWLLPATDQYCPYIGEWIGTKLPWGLAVFSMERHRLNIPPQTLPLILAQEHGLSLPEAFAAACVPGQRPWAHPPHPYLIPGPRRPRLRQARAGGVV
jgi:hypothetical protein